MPDCRLFKVTPKHSILSFSFSQVEISFLTSSFFCRHSVSSKSTNGGGMGREAVCGKNVETVSLPDYFYSVEFSCQGRVDNGKN